MSRKGHKTTKPKQKARRKSNESKRAAVAAPSAAEVVGAVLASVAPALFESADEVGAPSAADDAGDPSGVHAVPPRRGEEHRAHPRVALSVAIGLESESHFFAGLSGDVSEGGVFVQTYRDVPVGSQVEVHFDLPSGEITTHGRVRWHRAHSDSSPPGLGIAFEELDEENRALIHRFCERRSPLYYEVDAEHG